MRQLRQRPFSFLLVVLLLSVVVYPVLHETAIAREVYDVIRTLVLIGAFRVIFATRREVIPGVGIALVLAAGIWVGHVVPEGSIRPVILTLHVLATAFFALAIASILRSIYSQGVISSDGVAGALCAYLLLGIVFAHVYWLVEAVHPGSFRGDGDLGAELKSPRHSQFALQYFSFVTLASVGANDVTPVRAAARGVTVLEAICGQLFIAVLIADLIGKKVGLQLAAAPVGPTPPKAEGRPEAF